MNRKELNLLLYLETRAVDYTGRINQQHINDEDQSIIDRWAQEGYLETGRVSGDLRRGENIWVALSDQATDDALAERKARAKRVWEKTSEV